MKLFGRKVRFRKKKRRSKIDLFAPGSVLSTAEATSPEPIAGANESPDPEEDEDPLFVSHTPALGTLHAQGHVSTVTTYRPHKRILRALSEAEEYRKKTGP